MKINCAACGAKNDPINKECQYCGSSLSAQTNEFEEKIKVINEQGNKFKLAEVAFEGGNYDEAINYYNGCLEIDPDFFEAWYKKGLSIIMTSTIGNLKSQQSISAFNQAINYSPNADNFKKRLKKDIIPFVGNYYLVSFNHFQEFKTLANSGVEFAEKLSRSNDIIEYVIDQIGLEIEEIKELHGILSDIGNKMGDIILSMLFQKGGTDKVNTDFKHAVDKITHIRDEKLYQLWQKIEPETVPAAKKKSGCFIATAAMGDYNHPVVVDLRNFRDEWLLKRAWGIIFTNWYYTHGPKAASIIEKSSVLKSITFFFIVKPLQKITKLVK